MNGLSFNRFLRLRDTIIRAEQERAKEKLTVAAFIGWQMGAGTGKKFGEYLVDLGLSDESPQDVDDRAKKSTVDDTEALRQMGIEVKKVKA